MDAIDRNLRSYAGIISTARTRAAGIRQLLAANSDVAAKLKDRGIDEDDAKHLEEAAATLSADYEHMRGLWAQLQSLAAHLHEESSALADDIRGIEDGGRAALGRTSEFLPTLGVKPARRKVVHHKDTAAASLEAKS